MIEGIKEELSMNDDSFIICAEHTGQYTYPLMCACKSVGCKLWLENPSQIKYCSGVTRGKNDKVDARRIAEYAMRFLDKAKPYIRPTEELMRLKQLEAERSLYLTDLAKYKAQLSDQEGFMEDKISKRKAKRLKQMIKSLENTLREIAEEMADIIDSSEELSRQMMLLKSVEGVGPVGSP